MGLTPDDDPFKPPNKPREVACLHCGKHYQSDVIEFGASAAARTGRSWAFGAAPPPFDGQATNLISTLSIRTASRGSRKMTTRTTTKDLEEEEDFDLGDDEDGDSLDDEDDVPY